MDERGNVVDTIIGGGYEKPDIERGGNLFCKENTGRWDFDIWRNCGICRAST